MTDSEKSKLVLIIKRMLDEIQDDIIELEELTKPVAPDNAIGRVSRMDAINNKAINDSALLEKKAVRQKLEKALERSGDKRFGDCLKCGNPISLGRLEFMPYTTRCIQCAGR